jgi:drug/metabolite transporter (DMT)-like permease
MKDQHTKNLWLLHLCVLIWGFTPVLGKAISLQALDLVWWRVFITVVAIFIYIKIKHTNISINRNDLLKLLGIGAIIGVHWLAFYGAIKVSNVSVTLAAFSSGSLFSSFIEPIINKRKIKWYEIVLGILIVIIIGYIFSINLQYKLGIILGMLAALGSALFSSLNSIMAKSVNAYAISFYELLGAIISLTIILFFNGSFDAHFFQLSFKDTYLLVILSLVATAFTFILSINVLSTISSYTVVMALNLETVYGIILAYLFFSQTEKMDYRFYIGTALLLLVIVLNGYFKSRERSK